MDEQGIVFPVLPGKREALFAFTAALMGERKAEYEASQLTVIRESWFYQPTPMGDLVVIYFQCANVGQVFVGLATSQDPFEEWFRAQVLDITGVDLAHPPDALPPRIFLWERAA